MFGRHWSEFGHHRGRMFEKGGLKYVILDALKDKPSHGYEIIQAIGERFGGFYSPSPGSVYPTLQLLEDMGYVTVAEVDGKKVYSITEEGRQALAERGQVADEAWDRAKEWASPRMRGELHDLMHEMRGIWYVMAREGRSADPEKIRRVKEVAARARKEIEQIFSE